MVRGKPLAVRGRQAGLDRLVEQFLTEYGVFSSNSI
jgi:hypothetical protein